VETFLAPVWNTSEGVWLVKTAYARQSDPQGQMQTWLADRSSGETTYRYADSELRFYPRSPERAATMNQLAPDHTVRHPLEIEVSPGLFLVGVEAALPAYRLGDTFHLFLFWEDKTDHHSAQDVPTVSVRLALVNGGNQVVRTLSINPSTGPGLRRQQVDVPLTTDLSPGHYTIRVGGQEVARLDVAAVRTVSISDRVTIPHPLERWFVDLVDNKDPEPIRLLGYGLKTKEVQARKRIELILYWSATTPVTARYKVFTHILGNQFNPTQGSFLWGQHDAEPDNFNRPTTTWIPGEIVVDRHVIQIDAAAPPGRYRIEIGLYDGLSGRRLKVRDKQGVVLGDHIILDKEIVH
jgi:hypothetical protein